MASRGRLHWFVSSWENDPTSNSIYDLSEQFPNEFVVSTADVHFVIHGPIDSKIDGGYLVTDTWLSHHVLGFKSRSQLFTGDVQTPHSHYWYLWANVL